MRRFVLVAIPVSSTFICSDVFFSGRKLAVVHTCFIETICRLLSNEKKIHATYGIGGVSLEISAMRSLYSVEKEKVACIYVFVIMIIVITRGVEYYSMDTEILI